MNESNIVTVLSALVANRVYPDVAPLDAALPLITYQQVGGQAVNFLEAASSDKKNARIQVNVWALTRSQANALIKKVEDEMVKNPILAYVEGAAIATYDDLTKQRGALQYFSVWIS